MIRLLTGDCRVTLATLEPGSVQACITSPPYLGLRDYNTPPLVWGGDAGHTHDWQTVVKPAANGIVASAMQGETLNGTSGTRKPSSSGLCACGAWLGSLGLEPTPDLYLEHLVEVFRGVRRVLRDDGTLWVNLGDSYAGSNGNGYQQTLGKTNRTTGVPGSFDLGKRVGRTDHGYKAKDLMMMPARVAMALQADGWWLRSMIPWLKRNSMPESVTDRPATAVEYWFLLSKQARYFWDADAVRQSATYGGEQLGIVRGQKRRATAMGVLPSGNERPGANANIPTNRNRRNSDWFFELWQGLLLDDQDDPLALIVNPAGFPGAHFATFPPKLIEPLIKASTSEKGQCPECGAPWVRISQIEGQLSGRERNRGGRADGYTMPAQWENGQNPTMRTTTGWRPSCGHNAPPVPQTVLDPFGGAGTVGLVADRLGRNAVLCELSDQYTPMATNRLEKDGPMFMEIEVA